MRTLPSRSASAPDARGHRWLDELGGDLYAVRSLARTPGFVMTAVVSIALGVGANAIVFSVVKALVLKPLPIAQPDRVFFVQGNRGRPSQSFPNYHDLRDRAVSFDGLIGHRPTPINLDAGAGALRTWGHLATGSYFDVLGISPALGRFFHAQPVEIIGIVENGKYESLTEAPRPVVFESILQRYNATTTIVVKSPLPPEQVVAGVRAAVAALDPALPLYGTGTVEQMLGFALFPSRAAAVALSAFGLLAVVLSATGIHGLVAYTVARRRREIGIRVAVGANRVDILRVVFGRIALLLMLGAAAGLGLAAAAGRVLAAVVYHTSASEPDVMAAVIGVFLAIGVISGWLPTRRLLQIEPTTALRLD